MSEILSREQFDDFAKGPHGTPNAWTETVETFAAAFNRLMNNNQPTPAHESDEIKLLIEKGWLK